MESTTMQALMQVTPEELHSIRNPLDLDENKTQKGVDAIQEWLKKEDHLTEAFPYISRNIIERCLIISNGSLEICKKRIDKILTTRGLFAEIILNRSFEEFENISENMLCHPLPKCNSIDHTRIVILAVINENYDDFNVLEYMRYVFLIGEFRLTFDYIHSDRYIIDLKNFKANMLLRLNPVVLKKSEILCTETFGVRLKGIHIINAPPFVNKFVHLLKQVMKEKLAKRIYVHKSYEELYEFVSKDVLPKDYGGYGPSCRQIVEQWKDYFKTEEAKNISDDLNKMYSNESRRTSMKFNEEYLGMPGSFKQLNLD